VGDEIVVSEKMKKNVMVQQAAEVAGRGLPPTWIEVDRDALSAKIKDLPKREELLTPEMNEQLIVELYSR
jgi:small subunit ribosomal protein S4